MTSLTGPASEDRSQLTLVQTAALNERIDFILIRLRVCQLADLVREGVALEEKRKACFDLWSRNLAQAALAMLTAGNSNRRRRRGRVSV